MKNKLILNTILYALGPQIPKVAGILMMPFFTKHLTSFDYGAAGLVFAYTGLLGGLGDLGIHIRMSNIFFKTPNNWRFLWQLFYGLLLCWSFLFTLIQFFFLLILLPENLGDSKSIIIFLLSITSLFFSTTINFNYRLNQYRENANFITIITIFSGIISIIVNYIAIVNYNLGFLGWFVGSFVGSFIQFVCSIWFVLIKEKLIPIFKIKKKFLFLTLRKTLPLIPHNYSTYIIDSSDRFLLNKMNVSIKQIGNYSFAYNFISYFDVFISSLGMAISPVMARIYFSKSKTKNLDFSKFMVYITVLVGAIGIIFSLWIKEIMILLVKNDELKITFPMVMLMMIGVVCRPLYWYTNALLTYNNATQNLWKISLSAGVFNLIFNLIFIPKYGILSSVIGTSLSLIFLGYSGFYYTTFKKYKSSSFPILKTTFLPVLLVVIYFIKDINPLVKFFITILIIGLIYLTFSSFYKKFRSYLT